jgi:hypothetical protein
MALNQPVITEGGCLTSKLPEPLHGGTRLESGDRHASKRGLHRLEALAQLEAALVFTALHALPVLSGYGAFICPAIDVVLAPWPRDRADERPGERRESGDDGDNNRLRHRVTLP